MVTCQRGAATRRSTHPNRLDSWIPGRGESEFAGPPASCETRQSPRSERSPMPAAPDAQSSDSPSDSSADPRTQKVVDWLESRLGGRVVDRSIPRRAGVPSGSSSLERDGERHSSCACEATGSTVASRLSARARDERFSRTSSTQAGIPVARVYGWMRRSARLRDGSRPDGVEHFPRDRTTPTRDAVMQRLHGDPGSTSTGSTSSPSSTRGIMRAETPEAFRIGATRHARSTSDAYRADQEAPGPLRSSSALGVAPSQSARRAGHARA